MEPLHVCPHCGSALDKQGEVMVADRKVATEQAWKAYREYLLSKSWVYRNTGARLVTLFLLFSVMVYFVYWGETMISYFATAAILLFGVYFIFLGRWWDRYWRAAFRRDHPEMAKFI